MNKPAAFALVMIAWLAGGCGRPALSPGPSLDAPAGPFPDPVRYDLRIETDMEAGTIAGECVLTLRNTIDAPITVVPLNLYRLMEVAAVTDASGRTLIFTQGVRTFEDWRELQVNHIRVALEKPLAPGKETALRIIYGGPLLGYAEAMRYVKDHVSRDLTFVRSDSFAFPQIGVLSWKVNRAAGLKDFTYTASLTVPSPLVVANAGDLVSRNARDGRTTYVYKSRVPSWRIDLAAADYVLVEGGGGKFRIFAFPGDAAGARALLDSLTAALALLGRWFGPLPDVPGLTVIEVPDGYGSQADAAAVIQETVAFKDRAGRVTFYHELTHLWNVKATDPLPPRFESEGLAMFLQHLILEKIDGEAGAVDKAVAGSLARLAKTFGEHPAWKTTAMIDYGRKDLTDLSYRMGQIMFYLIYRTVGEEKFLEIMSGFGRDFRASGATAAQFVGYVEKRSGVDLGRIFEDWVFTSRAADVVASGVTREELLRRYGL